MKKIYLLLYLLLFSVGTIHSGNHKYVIQNDYSLYSSSVFAPIINTQPTNVEICIGGNASFSVVTNAVAFQWQVDDGTGFVNIVNGGLYSGSTTSTLTITSATSVMNGYKYRVQLFDGSNTMIISDEAQLIVTNLKLTFLENNVLCNGGATGSASAIVTGGSGNYTYLWDTNPVQTSNTAINLSAGEYTVTVKDVTGCTIQGKVTITQPFVVPLPTTNYTTQLFTFPTVATLANLQVNETNINWYNSLTSTTVLPINTPLVNGTTYYVSQYTNGCESERLPINVKFISKDEQVFCNNNVTVNNLNTSSSSGDIIEWFDSATSSTPLATNTLITTGTYYVSQKSVISTPTSFIPNINAPYIIKRFKLGEVLITTAPGNNSILKNYTQTGTFISDIYNIQNSFIRASSFLNTNQIVTGELSGSLKRMNADGTNSTPFATVSGIPAGILELTNKILVTLESGKIISLNLDGTGQQDFATGLSRPIRIKQLKSGNIVVAEFTGNRITQFNLAGTVQTPFISNVSNPIDVLELPNGKLWVSTTDGFVYQFDADGTNKTIITHNPLGRYMSLELLNSNKVLVADYGTNKVLQITIPETYNRVPVQIRISDIKLIVTATTNATCNNMATGSATVSATGGTESYTYHWNTVTVQTTATAQNLLAGTYTVTVTDSNGCSITKTVTINEPTVVEATVTAINATCNRAEQDRTLIIGIPFRYKPQQPHKTYWQVRIP